MTEGPWMSYEWVKRCMSGWAGTWVVASQLGTEATNTKNNRHRDPPEIYFKTNTNPQNKGKKGCFSLSGQQFWEIENTKFFPSMLLSALRWPEPGLLRPSWSGNRWIRLPAQLRPQTPSDLCAVAHHPPDGNAWRPRGCASRPRNEGWSGDIDSLTLGSQNPGPSPGSSSISQFMTLGKFLSLAAPP